MSDDKKPDEKKAAEKKAELTVQIALEPGPYVRQIGAHEWSAQAGWVQAVPLELAADLLAYPRPGWSLAERPNAATLRALAGLLGVEPGNISVANEPVRFGPSLAALVGDRERAGQLAEQGVTVSGLAQLTEEGIRELSFRSGASVQEIAGWVEQAKAA